MNAAHQKKTVVQVCFSTAWGGLEMSSAKWARLFQDNGYQSYILTSQGSKIAEYCKQNGISAVEFSQPRDYFCLKTRRQLKKTLNELQPEAVFNHLTKDLWHLSPVLRKFPKIRLYNFARMFIRGVDKNDFLHRYIYRRLDKMIALSHIQKSLLLKALPLPDEKYIVIPNGVDVHKFQPQPAKTEIREQLGASNDNTILVGLIGRVDRLKGHMEFVQAAAKIAKKYENVHFTLIGASTEGEGNEFTQQILHQIQQLQLTDRFTQTSHRTDIPDILNALDIFCMPSYEENFGNVMLEALASGTPSVGTHSGGTPEMIDDGHNGILVKPRSSKALADGLLRLIEDSEIRRQTAINARAIAVERFQMETIFQRVEKLCSIPRP